MMDLVRYFGWFLYSLSLACYLLFIMHCDTIDTIYISLNILNISLLTVREQIASELLP